MGHFACNFYDYDFGVKDYLYDKLMLLSVVSSMILFILMSIFVCISCNIFTIISHLLFGFFMYYIDYKSRFSRHRTVTEFNWNNRPLCTYHGQIMFIIALIIKNDMYKVLYDVYKVLVGNGILVLI